MDTTPESAQKDCPSCGNRIAEAAVRCGLCKSAIGKCLGCGEWIVEGTQCFECGKSTAVRIRKEAPKAALQEAASVEFHGHGIGLLVPLLLRQLLVVAWLGSVVLAVAASGVTALDPWIAKAGVHVPKGTKLWVLWAIAGGFLVAIMAASRAVRAYRARHTHWVGSPLGYQPSIGGAIGNTILAVVVLGMTAGLGVSWIYARQIRTFYRSCKVTGRGGKALEWDGSGEAVLGRFFLMLLLLPVAIATAGFGGILISWMWNSWERRHLQSPDRNGILQRVRFTGTFGSYFGRAALGWLLTLLTAGLYWPWAKIGDWEWIDARTQAA